MNEQETSADDSDMEFGELSTNRATRLFRTNWQFSLWALLVWLTIFALIGAGSRLDPGIIVGLVLLAMLLCGLFTFGFVVYWLLNAILSQSWTKAKRLGRRALDGVLGAGLVCLTIVVGRWLFDRAVQRNAADIDHRYIELREAIVAGDDPRAYSMMTPAYRAENSLATFKSEIADEDVVCPLEPGRSVEILGTRASVCPLNEDLLGPSGPDRYLYWQRIDGEWYFTGDFDGW